eukprot:s320_g6.t1
MAVALYSDGEADMRHRRGASPSAHPWCTKKASHLPSRRYSRKQLLLFLVAVVLCLGLVACLSYLIMVLFRVGPYRCSHEETPFTPDDCTRQLRGGFGFV